MNLWKVFCVIALLLFTAHGGQPPSVNLVALMPAEGRFQTVLEEIRPAILSMSSI